MGTIKIIKEAVVGALNCGMTLARVQEPYSTVGLKCISQKRSFRNTKWILVRS